MLRQVQGVVELIALERPGAQEVVVLVPQAIAAPALRKALNLIELTGVVSHGDRVTLNTVAVEMGLGTGGLDFVVSVDRPARDQDPPGHIMKLRYTPMQIPVLAVEAQESPYHEVMRGFETLNDCPVVCAELHSQVPAICAGARWGLLECGWSREPRITYIMTDGASLPIALSRLVPQMRQAGLIQTTITSGQAFGGDLEAINIFSALAAASAVAQADIIVVAQGPGNVGTDTPLGFSGIEQGQALNAVRALGGTPVIAPRISFFETRERHYGWSHHTLTVLQRIAQVPVLLPIPRLPDAQLKQLQDTLAETEQEQDHQPIVIYADRAFEAYRALNLDVTTMGRDSDQARTFFLASTAAGVLAAQLVEALSG